MAETEATNVGQEKKSVKLRTITSTVALLVFELCERLTFYSFVANLIIFGIEYLKISHVESVNISYAFKGVCYFIPILGGWLADSYLGRFNTILGSGVIYCLGTALLTVSAYDLEPGNERRTTIPLEVKRGLGGLGLLFAAVGTGGIKSNVAPYGAAQVESYGEQAVSSFFNWFYWFINIGAAIAFTVVAYVQQEISFFYGFLIPTLSMFVACIIFTAPKKFYIQEKPSGSALNNLFLILHFSIRRRMSQNLHFPSLLDYARASSGGVYSDEEVDNVGRVLRTLPILLCFIPFWIVYGQMETMFFLQGERMKLAVGNFIIPVASLNLFNTAAIIVFTPLFDRVLYPLLRRVCGYTPSHTVRIGWGMVLMAASMIIAGGVEIARKEEVNRTGGFEQLVSNHNVTASHITIFAQVPQYLIVSFGEIFASISGLEFAFKEAPEKFRGVLMGIFLCMSAIASFATPLLVSLVNVNHKDQWIPENINNGHMDYFDFFLCGLMLCTLVIYILLARWYNRQASIAKSHALAHAIDENSSKKSMPEDFREHPM